MLSDNIRLTDSTLERQVLEEAEVPSYWLLDPDVPSLTVLELVDGAYRQTASAEGMQALAVERPFPVTVVPADLLH